MKDYKPTVVFDFDGVIHSYRSGWKGPGITPDPVVPGIAEAIEELRAGGYRVIVVSTRCADPEGKAAVESYLTANGILVDGVMAEKPPAMCYVDDRAICFNGNAQTLAGKVRGFKTWLEDPVEFGELERYTEWRNGHGCGLPGKDCYTRLAEYEDTGLKPSEIDSLFVNDVLEENRRLKEKLERMEASVIKIGDVKAEDLKGLLQIGSGHPVCFAVDDTHPAYRLRPCKGTYWYKGERHDVVGRFHGWGADYEDFCEEGPGNFTVGIIECDDGTVAMCRADTIVFFDRKNEERR